MHIYLLYPKFVADGLATLLENEGYKVSELTPYELMAHQWPDHANKTELFLISVGFLSGYSSDYKPGNLLEKMPPQHAGVLTGKIDQLHLINKLSTKKKGFISTSSTKADLLQLLERIETEEFVLDRYVDQFINKSNLEKQHDLLNCKLHKAFSERELVIMDEISSKNTTKQIAEKLHISHHTIYNHRKNIIKK